jgi:hypothetical protein
MEGVTMDEQDRLNIETNRRRLQEQIDQTERSGSERRKQELDSLRKQLADVDTQLSQAGSAQQQPEQQRRQGNPVGAAVTSGQPGVSRAAQPPQGQGGQQK